MGYGLGTLPHPPEVWIFWGGIVALHHLMKGGSRAGRVTAANPELYDWTVQGPAIHRWEPDTGRKRVGFNRASREDVYGD